MSMERRFSLIGHKHALAALSDVDLTGLADGDTLVWDEASGTWIPGTPTGGGGGTAIQAQEEGSNLGAADFDTINFVGPTVTATRVGDTIVVTVDGNTAIEFQDEGVALGTAGTVTEFDVTGNGAQLSRTGDKVTLDVPGYALAYVGSAVVAGAAAQTLAFDAGGGPALDIDGDEAYLIQINGDNPSGSTSAMSLFLNADTTATNYDTQLISASSTTVAGARANNAVFGSALTLNNFQLQGWLRKDFDGNPRFQWESSTGETTAIIWRSGVTRWRTTATNVIDLILSASVASSLGIGTYIRVWKLVRLSSGTSGSLAPADATYLTADNETADLPNSRQLLAGTSMSFDDTVSGQRTVNGGLVTINTQTGNYTTVLGDAGKGIYRSGANGAATWTIPSNGTVAYPIGTFILLYNRDTTDNITLAKTSGTLVWSPGNGTGSRTIVPGGHAVCWKVETDVWMVTGSGMY